MAEETLRPLDHGRDFPRLRRQADRPPQKLQSRATDEVRRSIQPRDEAPWGGRGVARNDAPATTASAYRADAVVTATA